MNETLDTKWKKAIIQIANELKKANQISAIIGNGLLGKELKTVEEKKKKFKELEGGRRGVS
jgi:hypothetical protein